MMKKTLFLLNALLLAGIGASAASVDVSTKLLGNAQANWTNATGTYSNGAERYQDANYTASDGKILYQTITGLDNGIYEVTFYASASSTSNRGFSNISGTGYAQVFANSTVMDVTVIDQTACTPSDYEYTLTCEVTSNTLEFGLQNVGTGGNWYVCQGISLIYSGTALNTGDTYYASVADLCQWSISPTPDGTYEKFQRNTWSTESDASGMVPPFLEYWHGSGNNLDDAVITHKTLTGLTPGLYEVSVFARAFNENSTTAVGSGITFNANGTSVDLTTGTKGTYNGVSAEVYGTYTLVAEVKEGTDTLGLGFTIQSETSCDWLAWKNLKVVYDGESLPDLTYVTGTMNADVEAAMMAAVDAYNSSKSNDDYATAVSAIAAAEASVEYYAPIVAVVEQLDSAGLAVWNATANGQAYAARSLTSEDVSADLIAAQLAQTTAESDLTYVVQNSGSWAADQGNGPAAYNTFATETYIGSGEATSGRVLYYTVTGLQPGTYTVTFYAAANMANGISGDSGDNISVAYANDGTTTGITVGMNSAAQITSLDDMTLYTITCTVGMDGKLEFGIENVASGGNWFLGAVNSLTLIELAGPAEAPFDDQEGVYLMNLYDNEFLSRGHNYGTAADVDRYGVPVNIVFNENGAATIQFVDSKGYMYGDNWAWVDAGIGSAAEATPSTYIVTAVELDDSTTAYQFMGGDGSNGLLYVWETDSEPDNVCRVANNGVKSDNYSEDNQALWRVLTMAERDEVKEAWVLSEYQSIAETLGYKETIESASDFEAFVETQGEANDVTSSVTNAALTSPGRTTDEEIGALPDGWSISYPTGVSSGTINSDENCTEMFENPGDLYQNVDGLEPGLYKVTLQGFIRHGWYDTCINYADYDLSYAFLRANDYEINLVPWAKEATLNTDTVESSTPNNRTTAGAAFDDDKYNNTLYTIVGNDGKLSIEIDCPGYFGSEWVAVRNLTLTFYGEVKDYAYDVTKMLANPSFEEDDVSGITVDTRNAYPVSSVTGWTLPTLSGDTYGVRDIMTSAATATDNDFGAPGEPTDGSQMLYIRDAWNDGEDVKLTQELTLPAGNYKIAVDTKCISTTSSTGTLFADNANTALTINSTMPDDWDTATLRFSLDEQATVSVGIEFIFHASSASNGSFLLDNFRLYSETDVVEWTLGADYGTLILPFDAEVPSGLAAYTAGTVSNNELSLTDANSISANTPHIIGVGTTGTTGTTGTYYFAGVPTNESTTSYTDNSSILTGTLPAVQTSATGYLYTVPTTVTVSQGDYVLQNQEDKDGLAFYLVENDSEITCGSYHCYLDGNAVSGDVKSITFTFGDDVATRIDAVETEETGNEAIYDLSGRRVAKAQKGVYIVNGKKMVIK